MVSVLETVRQNNVRVLTLLVAVPRTLSPKDVEQGLLHAVRFGLSDCLSCLLSCPINVPDVRDATGNSPLHIAVSANKPEVMSSLINGGCEVNILSSSRNTPLHVAAKFGYDDCLDILLKMKANLNARDASGSTPLILAVRNKRYDAMHALLRAGCDPDAVDNRGCCALHYGCQLATGVKLLLQAGAKTDVLDQAGNTPLFLAAAEGFDNIVKAVAQAGCDPNLTGSADGKTSLHILAHKGHGDCIPDLVLIGADVHCRDRHDHTPLWYAINNGRSKAARVLLQFSDPLTAPPCSIDDPQNLCPASLALERNQALILKLLLCSGYDLPHVRRAFDDSRAEESFAAEDLAHWREVASSAMPLKELCRQMIRHILGIKECQRGATTLPLPESARAYLKMEDLEHVC